MHITSLCKHTSTSFQVGIKIHVENAGGVFGVHELARAVKQLFVFAHTRVL